jgi:hypothetical protein
VKPICELKPITAKVRTLGWQPTVRMRMPGGTLEWVNDEHRPGYFAYGRHHDYHAIVHDGIGYVGKWAEESLYSGTPDPARSEAYAAEPGATIADLIRIAESWENPKCNS